MATVRIRLSDRRNCKATKAVAGRGWSHSGGKTLGSCARMPRSDAHSKSHPPRSVRHTRDESNKRESVWGRTVPKAGHYSPSVAGKNFFRITMTLPNKQSKTPQAITKAENFFSAARVRM